MRIEEGAGSPDFPIATDEQFDSMKKYGAMDWDARLYFTMKLHMDNHGLLMYDGRDSFDASSHPELEDIYAIQPGVSVINDFRMRQ